MSTSAFFSPFQATPNPTRASAMASRISTHPFTMGDSGLAQFQVIEMVPVPVLEGVGVVTLLTVPVVGERFRYPPPPAPLLEQA